MIINMKKRFIFMVTILLIMVIIPLFSMENKIKLNENKTQANNFCSKKDLYGFVCKNFRQEYDTETIKALAVILQSNYSFNRKYRIKTNDTYMSKNDFYEKYENNAEKYYTKIKNASDSVYKVQIKLNGKNIYIPYNYVLKDNKSNKKYHYLKNCATPWDCLNTQYKKSDKLYGISLNTLNKLCKNNYSYEEALLYFTKNVDIKKQPE